MKKRFPLVAASILLLIGSGWYWQANASKSDGASIVAPSPQPVSTLTLTMQSINFSQQLPGRISSFRQSEIRPQVDGIITERLFEEGAQVVKGQQLYQIDDKRHKAALNSAVADLKSANALLKTGQSREKRYKDLVKINAVSVQEYDDVKADYDQAIASVAVAQAAVDVAKVNVDYTKVYAPISGYISRSFVTEGALVTANQTQYLTRITQLDPVYVDMQQSSSEAMDLRARMMSNQAVPVHVILDEKTNTRYPLAGEVKFSEVTIDEGTSSIVLRALMPNPDGLLLSGLFVQASLDLGKQNVLLVPQRATTRTPSGGLVAWVVEEGKAQQRAIEVDGAHKDKWIVTAGLNEGEEVIVEGYQKVKTDSPVAAVPWVKKNVSLESQPNNKG